MHAIGREPPGDPAKAQSSKDQPGARIEPERAVLWLSDKRYLRTEEAITIDDWRRFARAPFARFARAYAGARCGTGARPCLRRSLLPDFRQRPTTAAVA